MSVIQKLEEDLSILIDVEKDALYMLGSDGWKKYSIEDVKNLITELNAIHTEMVINKHKRGL